jgi:hypothetical protein
MHYLESTEVKTEDEDKLNRNSNLKQIYKTIIKYLIVYYFKISELAFFFFEIYSFIRRCDQFSLNIS